MRFCSLIALVLACSCEHKQARDDRPVVDASAIVPVIEAGPASNDASTVDPFAARHVCSDASARSGKSIGHTSAVFKLELSDGKKVAWKPNAKKMRGRYKGEIAAFRLASALAIENVPSACPHVFDTAS
ncbi:MAG TPA: hypothetical protein VM925_32485, partial [Labilithrix sp.]|nr:hypothetical protein [Labilithrix sp.]